MEWNEMPEAARRMRHSSSACQVGCLVEGLGMPGVGRVGVVDGANVRVDFFESVAMPVADSRWLPTAQCRPVLLAPQTRVFRHDPDTGQWRAGRVIQGDGTSYFVRFPNAAYDVPVPQGQLRVRWDRPVSDPVDVLIAGANESPCFRDARLPMLRSLTAQRAACAGVSALLSSAVEVYPHQVRAALTVLSDPVQRYLLADEVGLGKTIEAGLVVRQTLLDDPGARIVILAPDVLRRQWQNELCEKFFVDDFRGKTLKISAHETAERWSDYHGFDLLVVDEAHRLVQVDGPEESPYRELRMLAHSVPRLLLLSATPVTSSRPSTHLGLLHLLDRDLYRWEDRAAFHRRFDLRRRLATVVYALDADFDSMLGEVITEIGDLLPDDPRFRQLADGVTALLTDQGELQEESMRPRLAANVEALRGHISETYRLHRRMIRHRRAQVLRDDEEADTLAFEVRGRVSPVPLAVDSTVHQIAQDALLQWQTRTADWLRDRDRTDDLPKYGLALGVLVSRTGGPADDLIDALRWRFHNDDRAARRAGLTGEERAWLAAPPVAPTEHAALDLLAGADGEAALEALVDALVPIIERRRRVAVFCGPGTLAASLCDRLRGRLPEVGIGEHTTGAGPQSCESAVTEWRHNGGALVADATAEDGLNLQQADAVVHCRLPWSPNRLEQRLGRVDRYVGAIAGSPTAPARQYVLSHPDGEHCFAGAWLTLLTEGFTIFSVSVSTLQDVIDHSVPLLWSTAVEDGPGGMVERVESIRRDLAEESRQIDGMDLLESVHESSAEGRDIAASMGRLEADWKHLQSAMVGYAGDGEGGLRFFPRRVSARTPQLLRFERGRVSPLMSPRMFARAGVALGPELMQGVFNRSVALRLPGTRLFRRGHPFVDLLADVIAIDDRGQASAFCRRDPRHRAEPAVFLGLDYLVEADIDAALAKAGGTVTAGRAIRRQADRVLEPFLRRLWLPAGEEVAVEDHELVAWLDRPYRQGGGDVNLNADRIGDLLDYLGGWDRFAAIVRLADRAGRRELRRVTDLVARCEQATEFVRRSVAVRRAQARARQAAGRLVGDIESYVMDVDLTEALAEGLMHPRLHLVSITCLVRGDLGVVARAD